MKEEIEKILIPGQMSYEEYEYILNLIEKLSPCNMLVFGLGNDSALYTKTNLGYTLFIEDDPFWISKTKPKLSGNFEIFEYKYNTIVRKWINYLNNENILDILKLKFSNQSQNEILYNTHWDIVLIDGPVGYGDDSCGRMIPISTTYSLNKKHILIHDCDRVVENIYTRVFFGNKFKTLDRMRIYWLS
jgi:uncharacterized protein (TIGR01627 family)